jgi:hypothetical protein
MGRAIRFPQFSSLVGRWTGVRFLYALQASNGRIKVGRSFKPRDRIAVHARALLRTGATVNKFAAIPIRGSEYWTERALIERMARIGRTVDGTAEWFEGVKWGQAETLLRQIGSREVISR